VTFTVTVTDQQLVPISKSYSLTIYAAPAVYTKKLKGGKAGVPYSATLTATGGMAPYTWSLLPVLGWSLSSAGVLSGTPDTTGSYSFTVQVADQLGGVAQKTLSLAVK
jgi:hypothetical protein